MDENGLNKRVHYLLEYLARIEEKMLWRVYKVYRYIYQYHGMLCYYEINGLSLLKEYC